MTVVEAVNQVVRLLQPNERVIVCAPNNIAADVLLKRLSSSLSPHQMFRFMAFQRNRAEVKDDIRRYCRYDDELMGFTCPTLDQLHEFKVIVATCATMSKLYNYGFEKGGVRAVFLDECGHAYEPEVLAVASWLLHPRGLLILAGDPKQLGPVTFSNTNLRQSLLERLLDTVPIYQRNKDKYALWGGYNPWCITKLLFSYRCHPVIMKVPNELFYDGDLIDKTGDEAKVLCKWTKLPVKRFPMIFHGVDGFNEREGSSPSWFNISEAEVVANYIQLIKDTTKISLSDIGVITPYQRQSRKIDRLLQSRHLSPVSVGTAEKFQGQERLVIIISTVRTAKENLPQDEKFQLGFVKNPKRLNVAITRAKALVIIVGSPSILMSDQHWRRVLEHCVGVGSVAGLAAVSDEEVIDTMMANLSMVDLEQDGQGEDVHDEDTRYNLHMEVKE
jgi:helicase MOV-10